MTGDLEALRYSPNWKRSQGQRHHRDRAAAALNITRDTGEFLAVLVRATDAERVLEIGRSNRYSTLWLAAAACAIGGAVTTIEKAEYKVGLAKANFARSGLERFITLIHDQTVHGKTILCPLLWRRPTINSARCSAEA